jgi:hypothetical protein
MPVEWPLLTGGHYLEVVIRAKAGVRFDNCFFDNSNQLSSTLF